MLGEFSEEMDQTGSRMDSVLKKMEKVSHMTSSECFYSFIVCSSTSCVFISFAANVCNFSLKCCDIIFVIQKFGVGISEMFLKDVALTKAAFICSKIQ